MKQEPELIDLFAMFSLLSQTGNHPRFGDDEYQRLIAERAYRMATKMMLTRKAFINLKEPKDE